MNETPMLFPIAPAEFWKKIRTTIEEVVNEKLNQQTLTPAITSLPEKALPYRKETQVLFRVNKVNNVWYYEGIGRPGNVIDFVVQLFTYSQAVVLEIFFSFDQQKCFAHYDKKTTINNTYQHPESPIKIIAKRLSVMDFFVRGYLKKRSIPKATANSYYSKFYCKINNRICAAIALKNRARVYKLKSKFFEGNRALKCVACFDSRNANNISVFKCFFDFLSHQTLPQKSGAAADKFSCTILNFFFSRKFSFMEKYRLDFLYLVSDESSRKYTPRAQKRSLTYYDVSKL